MDTWCLLAFPAGKNESGQFPDGFEFRIKPRDLQNSIGFTFRVIPQFQHIDQYFFCHPRGFIRTQPLSAR
jgi:hypothetical protein